MKPVYDLLIPYLKGISGVTCIQPKQNAKAPPLPYVTAEIRSTQATGSFTTGRDDSASTESKQRTISFTVDVNIYASNNTRGEADIIAQRLLDGLEDHNRRMLAVGSLMAFQDIISQPNDISALIGEQHQQRVNLAMRWVTSREITYTLDLLDTVEITPIPA